MDIGTGKLNSVPLLLQVTKFLIEIESLAKSFLSYVSGAAVCYSMLI